MDSSTLILSVAAFVVLHPWLTALLVACAAYQLLKLPQGLENGMRRVAQWRGLDRFVGPNVPIYIALGALLSFPVIGVLTGL